MISLALAESLREAGLVWVANRHDFFAIPNRGMDDQVFVLNDMMARLDILQGWPVVAFHGAAEWALDYVYTADAVWLPTESQLRTSLVEQLNGHAEDGLSLSKDGANYVVRLSCAPEADRFVAETAEEAYGQALLYLLRQQNKGDSV